MRIDENGNLEIECDEDFKQGIVNDYGFTSNPSQMIYTKDLIHCVGLGLIDEVNGTRKRGLIHVLYNQEFVRNEQENIIIPENIALRTETVLDNFLKDFGKNENGKNIFKNPRAIMIYVRSLPIGKTAEKIVLRDEFTGKLNERGIEDKNRYENPMADFIYRNTPQLAVGKLWFGVQSLLWGQYPFIKGWLKKRRVNLYAPIATSNKKLPSVLNMGEDPKEVYYKEFSLVHNKIKIGMYNKKGVLLNKKDYEAWLDF